MIIQLSRFSTVLLVILNISSYVQSTESTDHTSTFQNENSAEIITESNLVTENFSEPKSSSLASQDANSIFTKESEINSTENRPTPEQDGTNSDDIPLQDHAALDGANSTMFVTPVNVTEHQGFLHGFVESLSVILVSELGDKTFFIAAILAMQNNKLTVFLAAISALAVMTVLSALLGFVVTQFIPRIYTYYTCTGIMFLFGLKMLYEAWKMSDNELEETQREVEEEIARRGSISSSSAPHIHGCESGEGGENIAILDDKDAEASVPMQTYVQESKESIEKDPPPIVKVNNKRRMKNLSFPRKIRENSWFGKKCWRIFKIFSNTFGMTFLAEWGDRSQLATIVLAGINDVSGVCVGGVLGHFICTGLAVLCGALIAKKISVRKVTLLGALVFIGFAIASLFIDPYEENHQVPDVAGDDHNATVYQVNDITFVESTTTMVL